VLISLKSFLCSADKGIPLLASADFLTRSGGAFLPLE